MYVKGRSVWISGGYLEAIYGQLPQIHQIFVHGQRTEDSLIAVVVPKSLQDENKCKQELLQEFEKLGKELGLQEYEIPKGVIIDHEKWTPESHLVTATGKLCRAKLTQKFKLQIDVQYTKFTH
jgi:fatty acid CoA ligase FadD9